MHVFKTETDVAQNLIDDFFLTLTVRGPFQSKDFRWKKNGGTGFACGQESSEDPIKLFSSWISLCRYF